MVSLRIPVCLAVFAFLVAIRPAGATEARLAGMLDNPMIQDDQDIVDYPGLLALYSDMVFLTVHPRAPWGNVGFVAGRDTAIGLWAHRTPRWDDLAETDAIFTNFDLPTTHSLFDILFGMNNGFGLRLSLAAGLEAQDNRHPTEGLLSTGGTTFGLDLQAGYSLDTPGYHADFGAGITFSYFEVVAAGRTTFVTGWIPSFMMRHRSVIHPRDPIAWIVDVLLTRRAYSATAEGTTTSDGGFGRWETEVVGGPRLGLPGGVTVWLGATLAFEYLSGEVADQEQPTLMGLGFPGLVASTEVLLWDTLAVRAGVRYDVFWWEFETPVDVPGPEAQRGMGHRFSWSTGLGLALGDFQIDGTVEQNLYFNGPQILGGGDPGFLGMISAAYLW